jgi:hypothetical protein
MEIAENAKGVQPKIASRLERLFTLIEKAADNRRAYKRHRTNLCTWKDQEASDLWIVEVDLCM